MPVSGPNPAPLRRPAASGSFHGSVAFEDKSIDFLWRLFNRYSKRRPRFYMAYAASRRAIARRKHALLPPREKFASTIDYYEAALPLLMAQNRFMYFYAVPTYCRALKAACQSILPKKIF